MNEVVIRQLKLAQDTEDVVQMLAVVPIASLLCPDKHILEVLAGAIQGGPNVKRYSVVLCAFLQCNKTIPPFLGYGMGVTWLMRASSMAADSQRFLCFTNTLPSGRRQIRHPSRRVGNASGAKGVGSATTSALLLPECPKRRRGEISQRSASWNLACSSLRISPFVSFMSRSTGQTLGTGGRVPTTHFWLVPFTQRSISSVQWKNSITLSFN